MESSQQRRLIGLNAALIAVLAVVTIAGTVGTSLAQPDAARARGEYTTISGRIQGDTTDAVYILDSVNQELVALRWDRNTNRFEGIGFRSLANDAKVQQGTR